MIKAMNLTKKFDDLVAVDHINAEIKSGSVFGLIGTNGAGKSLSSVWLQGSLRQMEAM